MVAIRILLEPIANDLLYLDSLKTLYKCDEELEGMKPKLKGKNFENFLQFTLR